ncbi:hypothetical protein BDA99DRAFT_600731 [Phascolomyces articulosus]|uniref:Uncharacterized protein n=1 Tax=Phascolomyces articulosus TaxID=60185 RepID=A0AAD5KAI9_9FUNG|nr:hypothetical protein BDA99DRAFT_600731 [Phascolomyces articulosus]
MPHVRGESRLTTSIGRENRLGADPSEPIPIDDDNDDENEPLTESDAEVFGRKDMAGVYLKVVTDNAPVTLEIVCYQKTDPNFVAVFTTPTATTIDNGPYTKIKKRGHKKLLLEGDEWSNTNEQHSLGTILANEGAPILHYLKLSDARPEGGTTMSAQDMNDLLKACPVETMAQQMSKEMFETQRTGSNSPLRDLTITYTGESDGLFVCMAKEFSKTHITRINIKYKLTDINALLEFLNLLKDTKIEKQENGDVGIFQAMIANDDNQDEQDLFKKYHITDWQLLFPYY